MKNVFIKTGTWTPDDELRISHEAAQKKKKRDVYFLLSIITDIFTAGLVFFEFSYYAIAFGLHFK